MKPPAGEFELGAAGRRTLPVKVKGIQFPGPQLAGEDEDLLVGRDAFIVLDLGFDVSIVSDPRLRV